MSSVVYDYRYDENAMQANYDQLIVLYINLGVPMRSDTNRSVQSHKNARCLKFPI